jgi:hypothetical protein
MNRRAPRTSLICPNTGSTVCFRIGLADVGDRPVAAVGQQRPGSLADPGGGQGRGGGLEHGLELEQVVGLLGGLFA